MTTKVIMQSLFILLAFIACSGGSSSTVSSTPSSPFLEWDPPLSDVQGAPIVNLAGYRIYYGTAPGDYVGFIDVPGNVTQYPIADLSLAVPVNNTTYYIAVTAFDYDNYESEYSNEITRYVN